MIVEGPGADASQSPPESPPPGRFTRRDWHIVAAVFVVGSLVRAVYLYQAADSPTFAVPVVDAMTYHCMAAKLAGPSHQMDSGYFWQPFFYPFLLAIIYLFTGTSIVAAKIVQIFLGAGTCAMTYALGRKVFGRGVGMLAAGMVVFYGPLIFWECDLMGDPLAGFWSLVILLLLLRVRQPHGLWTCFALGLAGALGILTRPTVLPFFAVACLVLAWTFLRSAGGGRLLLATGRNVVAGFLAAALPVVALNYHVTKTVALLPSSGGINMYVGNNPDMCRTLTMRPGYEWEQLCALPEREGIPSDQPTQQQAYYYRLVRQYVVSQPLSFLAGIGAKTLRFISSREMPRNIDIHMFRQWSSVLAALVWKVGGFAFPFGVLLPLTVGGLILRWRSIPAFLWIFLVLYPAAVILVFVAGRYRIPVVPVMAVVAAAGVFALVDLLRRGRWLATGAMVVVMGATVAVATVPGPFCEEQVNFEAELPYVLGTAYYEFSNVARGSQAQAHLAKAAECFAEAARIRPDYADAHNNLGNCRARQGRLEEALDCFRRAVKLNPKLAQALCNIGGISRKLGRLDEAEQALRQALALNESLGLAHYHLAITLLKAGRVEEAQEHLTKTAALDKELSHRLWARCMLADAQATRGQVAEAVKAYRAVLAAAAKAPPTTKARALKGPAWLLAVTPDAAVRSGKDAVPMAEFAARIEPQAPDAMDILAAAYAEAGRFDAAVSTADRALAAAEWARNVELATEIRTRRQLYQAGQPCRNAGAYPFFALP